MPFDKLEIAASSRSQRSLSFCFRVTSGVIISSLLSPLCFAAHPLKDPPAVPLQATQPEVATYKLTVKIDGATKDFSFKAGDTLATVLASENIQVSPLDRCSVPLTSALVDGATVTVVRVRVESTTQRTPIPFSLKQSYTPSLAIGAKSIKRPGKVGERVVVSLSTFEDDKLASQVKKSERVTPPVPQVEVLGTRGMTLASRGFFGGRRIIEMVATGYGPGGNGKWGERTASGLRPGFGVVAVDPRFIPLGTRLYIEGYGYAVAGDTGGAIKGNRIDLGRDTNEEAAAEGRKTVRVLVLN